MPAYLLVDNGSLRSSSTLNLRMIAKRLERETGETVAPVSLLHSSAVDPAELGGKAAEILEPALCLRLDAGEDEFVIVPLFLGPSRAWTEYLPKRVAAIRKKFPSVSVRVAPCLFDQTEGGDLRLARILEERIEEVLFLGEASSVILVDHGSPEPSVTYVRNFLAGQLSVLLEGKIDRIWAASMERRPGDEYRFGDPLLENLLKRDLFARGRVVVAMMFLSPGRHAGVNGDVDQICQRAEAENPELCTVMTGLLGDHPGLIPILMERLDQGVKAGQQL